MIDITIENFQSELLEASRQQPVLLDIWAPWCGPCKQLGPVLEKLEVAYAGRFVLAKLNSDEQPDIAGQLSQMFGVRSIPFCVMFAGGEPVDGFVGAIPEAQIRQFIDKHVPSAEALEAEEDLEEAEALAADGDADAALAKLQEAVAVDPANDAARFDFVKLLLQTGRVAEARLAYTPVAGKAIADLRLAALGEYLRVCEAEAEAPDAATLAAAIAANKRDFDARYALACRHFAAQRHTEAMDELLEILMRNKAWSDERARKTYVAILEIMSKPQPKATDTKTGDKAGTLEIAGKAVVTASDPVIDQYRRKLSMALF
jgi:putative thioredoxin